jgi:hypothetical protein
MIGKQAARASVFLILLVLFGSMFIYIPKEEDKVEAVGSPAIRIELAQTKQTAYVAPGQDGVVTFTGQVTATIPWSPNVQYLVVTLQADAGGWPVSVPPSLTFNRAITTQGFTLSVQVPVETSQKTQGQLSISGRWRYSPGTLGGTVDPATAIIVIKQYYQFSVGCDKPYVQVGPGSSLGFKIRLINEGNAADRLRVEITNLDRLANKGWTIQLSQDKFSVPEKQEKVLTVSVTTPVEWNIWKNDVDTIRLRIVSAQAESLGDISDIADYSLYIRQRGFSIPGYEPVLAVMALTLMAVVLIGFARRKRT